MENLNCILTCRITTMRLYRRSKLVAETIEISSDEDESPEENYETLPEVVADKIKSENVDVDSLTTKNTNTTPFWKSQFMIQYL